MLEPLISSRTRLRLLVKFFINDSNKGYLNGLALEFGESTNAIRRELNNLFAAGYLVRSKSKNKIIYAANVRHPLFKLIQKVVHHHLGLEQIVASVITQIGAVSEVHLIGDYANGRDTGTIEIIITAQMVNEDIIKQLQIKLKKLINRTVIFYLNTSTPQNRIILFNKLSTA